MSKRYSRLLAGLVTRLTQPMRPWRREHTRLLVAHALLQRHEIATRHGSLVFVSSDTPALQFPRDFLKREPETLDWIDSFATPCRFWDIGANIGTYALYAALRPQVSVLAFEPSPSSYAALARNIEANRLSERIAAYCLALSGDTRLGSLNMTSTAAGNSFNSFESVEDCFGRELAVQFRQATVGFAIDDFRRVFRVPAPNYLKIDVDGIEERILAGAAATLAAPELRSVLVELETADTVRNTAIVCHLARAGFSLQRRGAEQAGSMNAIFTRPATGATASAA